MLFDHYFNSSVVRLKVPGDTFNGNTEIYFNSSVVRLKVEFFFHLCNFLSTFQFQCGAIKSFPINVKLLLIADFNSSVVRLKEAILTIPGNLIVFQFQCGAIKS